MSPVIPTDKEPVGTPAWRRFFQTLVARVPVSGSATFAASDQVAVTLNPPHPDGEYDVFLEPSENNGFWVTTKSATGFTLHADAPTSSTIRFIIIRR